MVYYNLVRLEKSGQTPRYVLLLNYKAFQTAEAVLVTAVKPAEPAPTIITSNILHGKLASVLYWFS
jgi:hypothetical protein